MNNLRGRVLAGGCMALGLSTFIYFDNLILLCYIVKAFAAFETISHFSWYDCSLSVTLVTLFSILGKLHSLGIFAVILGAVTIISVERGHDFPSMPWTLVFVLENTFPLKNNYLLECAIISQAVDIFSYFGGKIYGKTKIFERLSPNKTFEGYYSGFAASLICGSILNLSLGTATIIFIGSVFGDLVFSAVKRIKKLEDFSNFIPGHGGLHDRIDSTIGALALLSAIKSL